MRFPLHFIFLTSPLLFLMVTGEVVKYRICSTLSNCQLSQLRIQPCPEATLPKAKPCVMKKGQNASIEFDFVGKPGLDGLKTEAYSSTIVDMPLPKMDTVGCNYVTCPTTGDSQTYRNIIPMQSYFPAAEYKVKWRLWKDQDMECCFTFRIKLEN